MIFLVKDENFVICRYVTSSQNIHVNRSSLEIQGRELNKNHCWRFYRSPYSDPTYYFLIRFEKVGSSHSVRVRGLLPATKQVRNHPKYEHPHKKTFPHGALLLLLLLTILLLVISRRSVLNLAVSLLFACCRVTAIFRRHDERKRWSIEAR